MKKKFKVDLTGEITLHHLNSYKTSLYPLLQEDVEIILDLNKTAKIDIAGIQLLLGFAQSKAKAGSRVYFEYHENQEISELFKILGVDKII